jgi:hypothetical protein
MNGDDGSREGLHPSCGLPYKSVMSMDDSYRSPKDAEVALLKKLLEKKFPGRSTLLKQLEGLLVRTIDKEGSLSIRVNPLAPSAEVWERVVSEGYYCDEEEFLSEGPKVNVLLHVVKGKLAEIEVYKDDGSPIKKGPSAEILRFH